MLSWIVVLIVLLLAFEYAGECSYNIFLLLKRNAPIC